MGFSDGELVLDSPNGSYYAGQTIFGKLIFQQDKVKQFRGIYVKCKGYCRVHWTTTHTRTVDGQSRTHHETHESEEEYMHIKVYLVGGETGEYNLQPGRHEMPFQFVIPQNCPSTFNGSKGHIRYEIKAVVDRAFKIDQELSREVTVISSLDLNSDPYCKEPMVFEFNDSYCCCCISSGSSETVIKLPASGFTPGQVVPVEIGCSTLGSSVEITEISFCIEKTITYNAVKNPAIETEMEKFEKTITGPVMSNSTRNWTTNLQIPDVVVGRVDACKYIDIQYELKVTIVPDGCHEDAEDSRRLIIGNSPLAEFTDHSQNMTVIQSMPIVNQPLAMSPNPYPNQSPAPGYPGQPAPNTYPGGNPPYPGGNSPYPGGNPPYPGGNPPYPGGNPPYPGGNPPYPVGDAPYPGGNPPYPVGDAPYPGGNPPYPVGDAPYPGGSLPHPGGNSPYRGANPPYPGGNAPYPGGNPPYPVANSPNPGGNPPYPVGNTPYPTVTPYPSQNAPSPQHNVAYQTSPNPSIGGTALKTGTVGFTVQSPGMPLLPNPVPTCEPAGNPYAAASAPPDN